MNKQYVGSLIRNYIGFFYVNFQVCHLSFLLFLDNSVFYKYMYRLNLFLLIITCYTIWHITVRDIRVAIVDISNKDVNSDNFSEDSNKLMKLFIQNCLILAIIVLNIYVYLNFKK